MGLQEAMFKYDIDCRVPFNEAIIDSNEMGNECPICYNLIIQPADIGNPECKHIFCKLCLQEYEFKKSGQEGKTKSCPLCQVPIKQITVKSEKSCQEMRRGIPSIIYQQIMEEHQSRFLRKQLVDQHLVQREQKLANDNGGTGSSRAVQTPAAV